MAALRVIATVFMEHVAMNQYLNVITSFAHFSN